MPPVREYSSWNQRSSDAMAEIEPLRKYVFICEGSKTEVHYFRSLVDSCESLGINPLVDLRLWEKTEADENISNPLALVRFAHQEKQKNLAFFHPEIDRMVLVFDLDIYSRVGENRSGAEKGAREFQALLDELDENDMLAVTNPSFELFLLLHREGSYERLIKPKESELLQNPKIGKQRLAQRLFTEEFGMNPKSNPRVGELVQHVTTAIEEERNLNQNSEYYLMSLTSTVGKVIESVMSYEPDSVDGESS